MEKNLSEANAEQVSMDKVGVLVKRARIAAGVAWEVGEGGNKTESQEPEVRRILRECASTIEALYREMNAYAETIDNVREALGQEETHYLVVADDVVDLVKAVELCASDGGCRAMTVLEKLRLQVRR